ncbi:KpsF/GutQ family sugar-phosphate isomerase [bacterium]|nr:KpsF/GutQ family sugar-phosphate isomerase [bacterium]
MTNDKIIELAKDVLNQDIGALKQMIDNFPYGFVDAVNYIANELTGKVIVAGMGKSGYVARRLATTLASTGTKSFFLHCAEASHGDMGIIEDNDCVIAMSNSGETKEMKNVLDYTRRFGIKLIAICNNPESSLGKVADINITIPDVSETCVIGKAPTTSIILLSAISNALIYALENLKGLTGDMYKNWHPNGKLGASLLKVSELMHISSELPLVKKDANMMEILDVMGRKVRFGCVGVIDEDGRICGIFTDGDIRRRLHEGIDIMKKTAYDVMGRSPKLIGPDTLASTTLLMLNENKIQTMFVVDNDKKPIGIIGFHDLLKAGVA